MRKLKSVWVIFFLLGFNIISRAQQTAIVLPDSVITPASTRYAHKSFIIRFLLGTNYRTLWATPVKMAVFHLHTTLGGFSIEELGGGMQTKSLHLKDTNGIKWVLRTVDKDAEHAIPPALRHTIAQKVTQDMISAANPYAPLVVGSLASAAGIIAAKPLLFFVPYDTAFGKMQTVFANTVCMLERRQPTPDNSKTTSTEKVLEKIIKENDHLVIQQTVLKARLLDMYIADWDRHADQWRWGAVDVDGRKLYYVIPRDRDQAFFYSNGLLVKIATVIGMPYLTGFRANKLKFKKLNYKSFGFDKTFLNELTASDWQTTITQFQQAMNDSVLASATAKLPSAIYALNGKKTLQILTSRRNKLLKNAMDYYRYLSYHVTIDGSNEKEIFKLSGDGKLLTVTVLSASDNNKSDTIYFRKFYPNETKRITINTLGGDDSIEIDETATAKIKVAIYGGAGADIYNIKGAVKNRLYDTSSEANQILNKHKSNIYFK